jgi:hypothetical protein
LRDRLLTAAGEEEAMIVAESRFALHLGLPFDDFVRLCRHTKRLDREIPRGLSPPDDLLC